jgi:DNA-binding response OmpR family regulator
MRVLLIDGDIHSANDLKREIEEHYLVDVAFDGGEGDYMAQVNDYAAIVIESNIPDMPQSELCRKARANKVSSPILMLQDEKNPEQRVNSLDCGADIVLTKPIEKRELKAFLRNMINRDHKVGGENVIRAQDLELHFKHREVFRKKQKINLRRKEYEILEYLLLNQGRVVSKEKLLEHVWEYGLAAASNTLEVHIKNLRDKIDRPFDKPLIKTIRGFGYKISV